eukprot:10371608-Lingulodinium_polyedra.AAC.1
MWQRESKGTGSCAIRPMRTTALRARPALTAALLAGPACDMTPRSLKVVEAGMPPPLARSHCRRAP